MSKTEKLLTEDPDFFEDQFARIWKEDRIIHFVYKQNIIIDYTTQVKHIEVRNRLAGFKEHAILSDVRGVKYWSSDARKYSNQEEATKNVCAVALIIDSNIQKIIWNWAVKFIKIKTAAKLFTNKEEDEAIKWLKTLIKDSIKDHEQ